MRKILINLMAALALLTGAAAAQAGGTQSNVVITQLNAQSTGSFYIYFAVNDTTPAACTTIYKIFMLDTSTAGGQSMARVAELAYIAGKNVYAVGTGTCNGSYEMLSYIYTAP